MRKLSLLSFYLLLGVAFLVACDAAETTRAQSYSTPENTALRARNRSSRFFDSPEYGVQIFMWWQPDLVEPDLAVVDKMGFGWVKQKFAWREIEGLEKGEFDWYRPDRIVDKVEKADLNLIVRLDQQPFWSEPEDNIFQDNGPPADMQDFGDFCGAVAERFQGRIAAYQVWNEPNLSREWGDRSPNPSEYVALLKACYEAIKKADPEAIVISAGLAPTGTDSESGYAGHEVFAANV